MTAPTAAKIDETDAEQNRVAPVLEEFGLINEPAPGSKDEAPDKPPRGRRRSSRALKDEEPKKRQPLPPWKTGQISQFVEQLYTLGGSSLIGLGNERYGQVFVNIAEPAGQAWEKVARRHEWLRRFFDKIMSGSEITELVMAHAPIIVMLFSDAGLLRLSNSQVAQDFNDELSKLRKDESA